ncbi:MAG: hypothetical protein QW244_01460 [Candidatus Pacearchaeota archaeon]
MGIIKSKKAARRERRCKNKKAAITLYVIIAIIIIAVGLFIYSIIPRAAKERESGIVMVKNFIEDCTKQWLNQFTAHVQIGCARPDDCYRGIPYFCYNDVLGENCILRDPSQIIQEHLNQIKENVTLCVDRSLQEAKKKGYETSRGNVDVNFTSTAAYIRLNIKAPITLKRGEDTFIQEKFFVEIPNQGNVVWQDYETFKTAVEAIAKLESEGDPDITEIVNSANAAGIEGLTISSGATGCWITIYALKKGTESFTFAIREVEVQSIC